MEPSQVIHQLRSRGLYPVVAGDSIRLFGDMRQLTDGLRDVIKANRAGIIAAPAKTKPGGFQDSALSACPYSTDHVDGAYRREFSNGNLHIGCRHDRCTGKTMHSIPDQFRRTRAAMSSRRPAPHGLPLSRVAGHQPQIDGRSLRDPNDGNGTAGASAALPAAPAWPEPVFPADIARYVRALAASVSVPVEMVAVPMLVFVGATMGNAVEVALKRGFTQPPALDHLYTTDPTLEALVDMLSRGRGVAIIRDELSRFMASFDKYRGGKGSDRQEYLSLWARTPIKADRKGGGSVYAPHPVAGIYGSIQPDLARHLHSHSGERDGMVERFLLFRPEVVPAGWTDEDVDPALLHPVVATFRTLRSLSIPDGQERIRIQLSPAARTTWVAWYNENTEAMEQVDGLRRGFYAKLANQVARIAMILHTLHHAQDPRPMIADQTMHDAIAVGEFFRAHLDRVLPLIGDTRPATTVGLSARVLRLLRQDHLQDPLGWVGRAQLLRGLGNVSTSELSDELSDLLERGVVETRTRATGTRTAEEWRLVHAPGSKDSQDSHHAWPTSSNGSNPSNGERVKVEHDDSDRPQSAEMASGAEDDREPYEEYI